MNIFGAQDADGASERPVATPVRGTEGGGAPGAPRVATGPRRKPRQEHPLIQPEFQTGS